MKCEVIVDKNCEEKVVIYARENSSLIESIKQLVREHGYGLVGYKDKEIMHLSPADIYCVAIMENKVYAVCENETWQIKERLYVLEEKLPDYFVKINQSCIINAGKIERFDASISGTLKVRLTNGYTDYVSRRQLKTIKERMGI